MHETSVHTHWQIDPVSLHRIAIAWQHGTRSWPYRYLRNDWKRRHSQRQHTNTHLTPNLSTHKYQRKESLKLQIKMAPSWLGGSGRLPPCVEMIMTLVVAPSAAADRRRGPVKRRPSGWWAEVWLFRLMGLSNTRCKPIVKNLWAVQTSCLSCPLLN